MGQPPISVFQETRGELTLRDEADEKIWEDTMKGGEERRGCRGGGGGESP